MRQSIRPPAPGRADGIVELDLPIAGWQMFARGLDYNPNRAEIMVPFIPRVRLICAALVSGSFSSASWLR